MSNTALQRVETRAIDTPISYNAQQLQLIKDTYAKGASDQEFQLFVQVAQHRGLDIFKGHMCLIKFKDKHLGREVFQPVVKIDGYRALAESTGLYEGQDGPYWCGKDGVWKDAWLETAPPAAARVGVYRKGFRTPMYAVARFDSYAQRWPDGNLKGQWGTMGDLMIAKCAEGLALRKAFPDMLGGLYTDDEMGQAQTIDVTPEPRQQERQSPPPAPPVVPTSAKSAPVQTPAPVQSAATHAVELVSLGTLHAIERLWPKYGQTIDGQTVSFRVYLQKKKGIAEPTQMPQEDAEKMLRWLQQKAIAAEAPEAIEKPKADLGAGLDQWLCTKNTQSRQLAMEVLGATTRLEASGVAEEEWREELNAIFHNYPQPVSRKSLTAEEIRETWLPLIKGWAERNEAKAKGAQA